MAQSSPQVASALLPESHPAHLSPLLVWAVVFCDIGTSVYYVPGILYGQVGNLAPLFVFATTVGFLFLAAKYVEICWRNPEGGGVVTIATKAFNPRWGCLGGMLITVDYFLTSAISSASGMLYLGSIFHAIDAYVVPITVVALVLLAAINVVGIKESAMLSLFMALAALAVDLVVIGVTFVKAGAPDWGVIVHHLGMGTGLSVKTALIGFSGAWLAFSGLESISQLSPAMSLPIRGTARKGMHLVVVTMLATAPLLTLFSVALLPDALKAAEAERFISELGFVWGGFPLRVAVVCTASVLLVFAANTAIIGGYHVFLALAQLGFLPKTLTVRNSYFGTPHFAIAVATIVPIGVLVATDGNMGILGDMYSFGLLGAFTLSSAGVDVLRWREGQRGLRFWVGLATTGMILTAWSVNLVEKHLATLFGGSVVAIGMGISILSQQKRIGDFLYGVPFIARLAARRIAAAEELTQSCALEVLGLSQATDLLPLYPSHTLVALRGPNERLVTEAINRERGMGGKAVYALFVEERAGLFVGGEAKRPDDEGLRTLCFAAELGSENDFPVVPVWTVSHNAAEGIARAARVLGVDTVMMGVSKRAAIYHLLRGHVVNGLSRRLPKDCHLVLQS